LLKVSKPLVKVQFGAAVVTVPKNMEVTRENTAFV
jgi:hypothetical protein